MKFKLWNKSLNLFETVQYIKFADGGKVEIVSCHLGQHNIYHSLESESHKLCQFTGVYDKNCREIYVDDLVRGVDIKTGEECKCVVRYDITGLWFDNIFHKGKAELSGVEIIGHE